MRTHPLFALTVLGCSLAAQAPIGLDAPIRNVRLHPDEAWITRAGRVNLPGAGVHRILLAGLPSGLTMEDVRVSARGPAGTRLGDLTVGSEPRKVTETADYKALIAEREALMDRQDALEAEGEALEQERSFLKGLQAAHDKELSSRMAYATPGAAPVVELSKGLQGRLTEVLTRDRHRVRELAKLKGEMQRIQNDLGRRAAEHSTAPSRAAVEVSTGRAGEVEVEFTYRSRKARWEPAYEARLAPDGRKVEVALFATVRQDSGEDWRDVRVEVTSTRSSRSLTLARYAGARDVSFSENGSYLTPGVSGRNDRSSAGCVVEVVATSCDMTTTMPAPVQNSVLVDAVPAAATHAEETRGLASSWTLEGGKDVPSDREPHRFLILAQDMDPTLALVAVPRLDPTVYQVARFQVPAGFPLFPDASVVQFAGTQRVGTAPLEIPAPGKPLQLGFGPFQGARVALQRLSAKKEMVGTFSKDTQWTLRERMDVTNDTAGPLQVELQDQELKAVSGKVKISPLAETQPGREGLTPGVLTWTLDLGAGATGSVNLGVQIRTPVAGFVSGLGTLNLPQ